MQFLTGLFRDIVPVADKLLQVIAVLITWTIYASRATSRVLDKER